jgi:hypothetical protein
MIWVLRAFILEKTNLISKFKRHDSKANTVRRSEGALPGVAGMIKKSNFSF